MTQSSFVCFHENRPLEKHLPDAGPSFQMPFLKKLQEEWTLSTPHDSQRAPTISKQTLQ